MARRTQHPVAGSAHGRHEPAVEAWAATREVYLDNLKVILIAAIIAGHGVVGYSRLGFWPYAEMREVTLSPVVDAVLVAVVLPFGLLMIPLLFLVAGLLTPPSLERKGVAAYVRDRLLRLGVPFAVFVLLLWPALMYPVHEPRAVNPSYWTDFLREGSIDSGPLWFVGVLLIFSVAYAGWVLMRGPSRDHARVGEVRARHLVALVVAVTVATFLIRLGLPYYSDNKGIDLNLYQWPECVATFALGIVASRQGWLRSVPARLRRQSIAAIVVAAVIFAAVVALGGTASVFEQESWRGGMTWNSLLFSAFESTITVFGAVWVLGLAQRHLDRHVRWIGPAAGRAAYGAFLVQGVVLIGLAVALRPVPLPAELKALLVAGGAVAGSFALAWLLIRRVPWVARVL